MTQGLTLKVERTRAQATQRDVGRYMGISASRVSIIERTHYVPSDTAYRFRQAIKALVAEREAGVEPWSVEIVGGLGDVPNQYSAAKAQARAEAERNPGHRSVSVKITPEAPAATVLGYLDGLEASGVSPVLLDSGGTIVNRRVG